MGTKLERSDVKFPLWRKKVDSSLLESCETPIPQWVAEMWNVTKTFAGSFSRKTPAAEAKILFQRKQYRGWVTIKKPHSKFRLSFEDKLGYKLKRTFLMSYMRSLESKLSKTKNKDIEIDMPFWEFLDIEFDHQTKTFLFKAHYKQFPSFPELFKRLIGSPSIKVIDDELSGKRGFRIHKQKWKKRDQLPTQLGAQNVIYTLLDSKRKLIYVGEAKDLIVRLQQGHEQIPEWDFFRYNTLPSGCSQELRVSLERMVIRDFAELFSDSLAEDGVRISEYQLTNRKIDG